MNYSDFFKMIPEASLIAILIVLFVADFATAKTEERKWFNPLASVLLLLNTFVCLYPMGTLNLFGGMYETTPAVDVMKAILSMVPLLLLFRVVFGLQRAVKKLSSICSSFQHCSVCSP